MSSITSPSSIVSDHCFSAHLRNQGLELRRKKIETLQINIGKRCNQACHHCHVEASPIRTENMTRETMQRVVALMNNSPTLKIVDITGGAPELNPYFRELVQSARAKNLSVIDRCNLTILLEPGQETLVDFLAQHRVEIIASLPCYLEKNVDKQRGSGVFQKSIIALQKLNQAGYGQPNTNLTLNLIYNPLGAFLPPNQLSLESQYKEQLRKEFGITFNHLFTITNMPIKRFHEQLVRENKLEKYMDLLIQNFNPNAVEKLMCRTLISVGWEGKLYDCDFNQMLELSTPSAKTIWDIDSFEHFEDDNITLGTHCFGCTAGSGSSCGGTIT